MLLFRPVAVLAVVLAAGCSTSSGPGATTPRAVPTTPAPSFAAGATVFDGATATIPLPATRGHLVLAVESERTSTRTTTTLSVTRQRDCRLDDARLLVCTTVYRRRKVLPAGAFAVGGVLATARLTTTVEGTRIDVTWTGYGEVRRKVDGNGNLLVEARDAKATTTWGRVAHTDRDGTDEPSSLYRRVKGARP